MPETSSTIRTVPGGNVGPAGGACSVAGAVAPAAGVASFELPRNSAVPTTATSTSNEMPTIQGVRAGGSWDHAVSGTGAGERTGGVRTGEDCTATPGPARVATSDQPTPSHHRTTPAVPSGSGYHPGAGCAGPVTTSA